MLLPVKFDNETDSINSTNKNAHTHTHTHTVPGPVTNLTVTDQSKSSLQFNWTRVETADLYLYRLVRVHPLLLTPPVMVQVRNIDAYEFKNLTVNSRERKRVSFVLVYE